MTSTLKMSFKSLCLALCLAVPTAQTLVAGDTTVGFDIPVKKKTVAIEIPVHAQDSVEAPVQKGFFARTWDLAKAHPYITGALVTLAVVAGGYFAYSAYVASTAVVAAPTAVASGNVLGGAALPAGQAVRSAMVKAAEGRLAVVAEAVAADKAARIAAALAQATKAVQGATSAAAAAATAAESAVAAQAVTATVAAEKAAIAARIAAAVAAAAKAAQGATVAAGTAAVAAQAAVVAEGSVQGAAVAARELTQLFAATGSTYEELAAMDPGIRDFFFACLNTGFFGNIAEQAAAEAI